MEDCHWFARFPAGIWQIHLFCKENTRTTAVFIIKYLKSFGFHVDNNQFSNYSWYFKNTSVRANYNNLRENIHETTKYLELFFANLLLGSQHVLKNRYLHVDYHDDKNISKNIVDRPGIKMSDKEKNFYDLLCRTCEKMVL